MPLGYTSVEFTLSLLSSIVRRQRLSAKRKSLGPLLRRKWSKGLLIFFAAHQQSAWVINNHAQTVAPPADIEHSNKFLFHHTDATPAPASQIAYFDFSRPRRIDDICTGSARVNADAPARRLVNVDDYPCVLIIVTLQQKNDSSSRLVWQGTRRLK